jgi:predicted metal-dependent enzyme (double-stranded beta helix superfamily)
MPGLNPSLPPEIANFCDRCAQNIATSTSHKGSIAAVMKILPDLLLNRDLLARILEGVIHRKGYPDVRRPTVFDNELILFAHPERLFSVRMYLWGPKEYLAAHDHNAWGVIGTATAGFHVVNYNRVDDGTRDGYAHLEAADEQHLRAGESVYTLPLNQGIHKTGNVTAQTIITLSVYGKPIVRDYIQMFDVDRNRVSRLYTPRRRKEALAADAFKSLVTGGR